jgi:hypothetical protein
MTIHLSPVLGTLNIFDREIEGQNLKVIMDGKTLLYELQRFLSSGKRSGKVPMLYASGDRGHIGVKLGTDTWVYADQWWSSMNLDNKWTLTVPLQSIIDRLTPERYLFMTPPEWRQENMEALKAAWAAGLTIKVKPPVESP